MSAKSTSKSPVESARAELSRLDSLLDDIANLKSRQENCGALFVAGEITLGEAAGLLAAASVADRHDLAGTLRSFVKREAREVLATVQGEVEAARHQRLDAIRAKLDAAESAERAIADEVGLGYHRGPVVNALADQVSRLEAILGSPATREELAAL